MEIKSYCMINANNVCDNVCLWDGNTETWVPPEGYLMLPQETTPAKNWVDDILEVTGIGSVGYIWDGVYLIQQRGNE